MAVLVTQTPVTFPSGIRATTGVIDFNGTTYAAGGLIPTIAQWGGGLNGIPNRFPDFVIFGGQLADDDADTDGAVYFTYHKRSEGNAVIGSVCKYGDEPLVDQAGIGEGDAAASSAKGDFLALWISPDPVGAAKS